MARKYYDQLYKLLLIGDSAVGKTSLLLRFSDDLFTPVLGATIGIDFKIKTIEMGGQKVKLQIWDTAGQERFETITTSYYRGSDGILLVYDITNPTSFQNVEKWLRYIQQYADDQVEKVLVGNKCDLVDMRNVSKERGQEIAQRFGIRFIETSAKANLNVDKAFFDMAEILLKRSAQRKAAETVKIKKGRRKNTKSKCC